MGEMEEEKNWKRKFDELTAELAKKDAELAKKDAAIVEKDAELAMSNAAIKERDAEIAMSNAAIKERDAELAKKDAAIVEKDAELAMSNAAIKERDAELAMSNAAIKERDAEIAKKDAMSNGTYFALIDDVFVAQMQRNHSVTRDSYDQVCRSAGQVEQSLICGIVQNKKKCDEVYRSTDRFGRNDSDSDLTAADGSRQTRSSLQTENKHLIWKCSVTGSATKNCEVAHLVPASVQDANTYWFVTDFLFGDRERSWEERLRLLHGTHRGTSKKRIDHTGIKHSVANKIFLGGQYRHFDKEPNVLIIPICDIESAKSWSGKGYEAIMLIDVSPPRVARGVEDAEDIQTSEALKAVTDATSFSPGVLGAPDIASHDEVRMAHTLVEKFSEAILYALTNKVPNNFNDDKGGERRLSEQKRKRESKAAKVTEVAEKYIQSRHFVTTTLALSQNTKVRKVKFTAHNEDCGHPAPDPMLLATRAAIQLQKRHGVLFAAAGEADSDDEQDEFSALAEEEFLRSREQRCKVLRDREIIGSNLVF